MKRNDKGFSLVDFLIVVAILLIMVGMVGPRLARTTSKAKLAPPSTTATIRPAR